MRNFLLKCFILFPLFVVSCGKQPINLSLFQTKIEQAEEFFNKSNRHTLYYVRGLAGGTWAWDNIADDGIWRSISFSDGDLLKAVENSANAYRSIIDAEEEFIRLYTNNKSMPESFKAPLYELRDIIKMNAVFIKLMAEGNGSWRAANDWKSATERAENVFKGYNLEIERLKKTSAQ